MKFIKSNENNLPVLSAAFDGDNYPQEVIKEFGVITEFIESKNAYIYLGKKDECGKCQTKKISTAIISQLKRDYAINVNSFITEEISAVSITEELIYSYEAKYEDIFTKRSKKGKKKNPVIAILGLNSSADAVIERALVLKEAITFTKNLQIMPPNYLTSEEYGKMLEKEFASHKNIKVTVLGKKEIQELKMGLMLAVNMGSAYEPRVVILEYTGDPTSSDKTVLVGKGITFDSGGMNLKPGLFMDGMKFDMSGSAVVAGAMKAISQRKPKTNVTGLLMITDNMISPHAMTADSVHIAMNGISVEINHTDAEGRLVLADGLAYATSKLKATKLIDVATLTGAMLAALGQTYTGVWSSTGKAWDSFKKAAEDANELVWRMPFHSDFKKYIKKSTVADLKNSDFTRNAGSSSAAMFLKEFTNEVEYIHLDIAGTADIKGVPKAPMIKTLLTLFEL